MNLRILKKADGSEKFQVNYGDHLGYHDIPVVHEEVKQKRVEGYVVIGQDGKPFSTIYSKPYELDGPYAKKHRWGKLTELLPGDILTTEEELREAWKERVRDRIEIHLDSSTVFNSFIQALRGKL
jgi:hypothetical protein